MFSLLGEHLLVWLINTCNGQNTTLLKSVTQLIMATGSVLKDRWSESIPQAEKEERIETIVEDEGCLLAVSCNETYSSLD